MWIAEDDDADLGFFEVQGEAEIAAREVEHLVEHHVAQAFDSATPSPIFADDADVAFAGRGFQSRDLRFDFFQNAAHDSSLG